MLITEKYPEYKKEWKWGIKLRNISIFAIIMFVFSLLVGGIVLINTKNLYHLIWMVAFLFFFMLLFHITRVIKHPRCKQCGFKSDNETFDISPSDFFAGFGVTTETVVYKGCLYTRMMVHNTASKADKAYLVTLDYYVCHTCKIYFPTFNKNYELTAKSFDALKGLASGKKKKKE
jgi:energy-coupling factor transporter transmembrane protein EcfT